MKQELITEIRLIKRYSRHNESVDITFRNYVKHELRLSSAQLDAEVSEMTDSVWKEIDCLKCANCCRTLEVEVDDDDIVRIAKRLDMTIAQTRKEFVHVAPDRKQLLKGPPCSLLGEDNKCRVYEDRPKSCRDFPYLYNRDVRSRTLSMLGNLGVCPIVFNVWQRMKERYRMSTNKRSR